MVFADKEHYLHQKPNRHQGRHTKQHKKQLVQHCTKPYHRWQPHRSGYQCSACGIRVHQALTAPTIEERLGQPCPQIQIDEEYPEQSSPHKPIQRKLTRAQVVANLLEKQAQQQPGSAHTLEETKGYLRCTTCGQSIHKRTNEAAFTAYVQGPCINQLYDQVHSGHNSHLLWQKGDKIQCKHCGTQTHTDAQGRPIITATLQKSCKGAPIAASPPISEIFKRQTAKASQAGQLDLTPEEPGTTVSASTAKLQAGHETQPNLELSAAASHWHHVSSNTVMCQPYTRPHPMLTTEATSWLRQAMKPSLLVSHPGNCQSNRKQRSHKSPKGAGHKRQLPTWKTPKASTLEIQSWKWTSSSRS